jgi:four helix bundle protein
MAEDYIDRINSTEDFSIVEETAKSFQDLFLWRKAHKLVLDVYSLTQAFPKEELYGLTNQLRRAAVSVPANIAEGFGRMSKLEKIRFYNIAQGSLSEVKYFLILTRDLSYGDTSDIMKDAEEVSKMIDSYIKRISTQ